MLVAFHLFVDWSLIAALRSLIRIGTTSCSDSIPSPPTPTRFSFFSSFSNRSLRVFLSRFSRSSFRFRRSLRRSRFFFASFRCSLPGMSRESARSIDRFSAEAKRRGLRGCLAFPCCFARAFRRLGKNFYRRFRTLRIRCFNPYSIRIPVLRVVRRMN